MENNITIHSEYQELIIAIGESIEKGRQQAVSAVNSVLVATYWNIVKYIIEFEQKGNKHAKYGDELLISLAKDLTLHFGRGFSRSNLTYMRKLYLFFPKCETLSHKLSWSHYNVKTLKANGLLIREGANKNGSWKIISKENEK